MTTVAAPRRTTRDATRSVLWVDVPFTKAPSAADDGSGDIVLAGYASTWGEDRDAEAVARDAFDTSLANYLSKNPMLLWQHSMDWPIGMVKSATTDETGLYVTAVVPNPGPDSADWQKGAYTSIKNGVVRTFSIGGYFKRVPKQGKDGPVFTITDVDLFEISCVSIPANADSVYEAAVKALSGGGPVFSQKAHDQMEQLLAVRELTDPELRGMGAEERQKRYDDLASLFESAYEIPAPPRDAYLKVARAREAGVDPAVVLDAAKQLHEVLSNPAAVAEAEKAGRAISAANQEKLQTALAAHDQIQDRMIAAAKSMQDAAGAHDEAVGAIKDVLGVSDEAPPPDPDEDEREDEGSPEKSGSPDAKQLTQDLFARFSEAGRDRFAAMVDDGDPDAYCYVYVDDFDLDQGYVVYCVSMNSGRGYYQVSFTRDGDGGVTLAAGQTEVSPVTGYVPKSEVVPDTKAAEAYERDAGETVQCPSCNRFNMPDASFCDQCGYELQGRTDVGGRDGSHDGEAYEPAAYSRGADEDVQCEECGLYNEEDASHCDQCGALLPNAGSEGAGETSASVPDSKGALSAPSAAFAPRDTAWSAPAAIKRVRTWAGVDGATDKPNAKAKRAFLWQDGDGSSWGDLGYPVCDVVDGEFRCVFKGVTAAAGRASQQGLDAIKPALTTLYSRASKQFSDDSIKPPWSED